jgi:hypothetical protein
MKVRMDTGKKIRNVFFDLGDIFIIAAPETLLG